MKNETENEQRKAYVRKARELYEKKGEIEIVPDDTPSAVSEGTNGVWVMAWVRVEGPRPEAESQSTNGGSED